MEAMPVILANAHRGCLEPRSCACTLHGARKLIAYWLIWLFLIFASIQFVASVGLSFLVSDSTIAHMKSLMEALATPVSSISALVGFVLGYHFKSAEKDTTDK